MAETSKERANHRGQPAPHLGQDHYEKSRIEVRAGDDNGPAFAPGKDVGEYLEPPQQPADVTYEAQQAIEKGSKPNRNSRSKALKAAVDDLDGGLAVKPD